MFQSLPLKSVTNSSYIRLGAALLLSICGIIGLSIATSNTAQAQLELGSKYREELFPFAEINFIEEETLKITLSSYDDRLDKDIWSIPQNTFAIFYSKLKNMKDKQDLAYEEGMENTGGNKNTNYMSQLEIKNPTEYYQGLELTISRRTPKGNSIKYRFNIFNGYINNANGEGILRDFNRDLEFWLFGLNNSLEIRKISSKVLPIISFSQCKTLGNPLVYTKPIQCILPNDEMFLDVPLKVTQQDIDAKSFDDCLKTGKAIIDSFPRRCMMASGHVFSEPARVPEVLRKKLNKKPPTNK